MHSHLRRKEEEKRGGRERDKERDQREKSKGQPVLKLK